MFLSIIIPSYNHGDFIEECLKKILNQKFKYGYEIIIVDRFSKDQTKKIVKKYKKKYKKIYFYQRNLSQAQSINLGIKKSKGLYVAWQNCDDYYKKNAFKFFYQTYQKFQHADIIFGNMDIININGDYLRYLHFEDITFYKLFSEGMLISNQSSIFKKELFKKFQFENFENSFDYDFFLKMSYNKKTFIRVQTNQSLGVFRVYKEQKSYSYNERDNLNRDFIKKKYCKNNKWIYNSTFSKILRMFFLLRKYNFKYVLKYSRQMNIYKN
jgi:glycosyltransferase involved in cell wall biosynthesis